MKVAALDLGSNTSLLLIADVSPEGTLTVLSDETTVTKMGQGVHANRRFHPEALERMRACLTDYSAKIKAAGCEKVIAVATSAARDVSNGDELLKMGRDLGIPIHIISGDREAQLTFRGALSGRQEMKGCAVVDVGGGSTEIIFQTTEGPKGKSIDVGSVRLTELLVTKQPLDGAGLHAISEYVRQAFDKAGFEPGPISELVAVAGTPTTLAALDQRRAFSDELVNGYKLSVETIEAWARKLAAMTIEEREALPGMQPKRSDVIVTGSLILAGAIRALKQWQVTVSTRGVRYGVALEWQSF